MRQSPGFANVFEASVAEGLANTLGAIVMQTLKSVLSYSFEAYAEKPSELHRELSGVFGSGATTLERMITKELSLRDGRQSELRAFNRVSKSSFLRYRNRIGA